MDKKENYEKYEKMYEKLMGYEQRIHERNQKRIRIGLKCIFIIPLIFLILLFWTASNKVVFLILWIVSLFGIATYLIVVEYTDYNLQEKMNELREEDGEVDALLGKELDEMGDNIKSVIQKIDSTLNVESGEPITQEAAEHE